MKKRMTVEKMMDLISKEEINTWFDLGLYIDKIKEDHPIPSKDYRLSYEYFQANISGGGIAFLTFYYSVDGVTIEIEKYAKLFRDGFKRLPIHYIAGKFYPESSKLIHPQTKTYTIPEMCSFDEWPLFKGFFQTKLERGSKEYNLLIERFWKEVLIITEKLGRYIVDNNIKLLYLINVCSNPGNVSMALASVLVSEYLGVPVINNNHDFYWEGGSRGVDIEMKRAKKGPRDFFFTNSHLGEVFSIIEMLYPWKSRNWLQVNINRKQSESIIHKNGINPANVMEIGTAVDMGQYSHITKRQKINTFHQFEQVLSRYSPTLIRYSVGDVINSNLVDRNNPRPILIGATKTKTIKKFLAENIIFLQPTRVVSRKRIELGFRLIRQMFKLNNFVEKFRETKNLKLTVLVTGPIPVGQYEYFEKLVSRFEKLLEALPPDLANKINLAFFFSELDKEIFKQQFENPAGIPELYNIASLVLLPSKTEGRGLPIIEATACGTPIFCRRYEPLNVYSEVIGEHLPEKERLKVIEFDGKKITLKHAKIVFERVFFPHNYIGEIRHNREVVQKRYSLEALQGNLKELLYRLFRQMRPNDKLLKRTKIYLESYKAKNHLGSKGAKAIMNIENREYLPGFGKLSFMLYLKSLIDPSFFRTEEMEVRGKAFQFAIDLIESDFDKDYLPKEKVWRFFNYIDNIFKARSGEVSIRHDHSLPYRHRNKNNYLYQHFTIQELSGAIRYIYLDIFKPEPYREEEHSAHFFTDWNLALSQLTSAPYLAIDDREWLIKTIKSQCPLAFFPGHFFNNELEFFALQPIRQRLKLDLEEELTEERLVEEIKSSSINENPIYIFAPKNSLGKNISSSAIKSFLESGKDKELSLLYKHMLLRVVKTNQFCEGIHFGQLGEEAIKVLCDIRERGGCIVSNDRNAIFMTDVVDIDRFHIGKVRDEVEASLLGIPLHSGYIQFAPAGVRTTLSYPTPIQTAKDFYEGMRSDLFQSLERKLGRKRLLDEIRKDAEENMSPLSLVLEGLSFESNKDKLVDYKFISGVYGDGFPYNGVLAISNVANSEKKWEFTTVTATSGTKRVTSFVEEWENASGNKAEIAWNGGYILNPELVGKLGQPESYIGTPLGLLISNRKVLCPPLFNKAALLIYKSGKIDIERVNCSRGLTVEANGHKVIFSKENYNKGSADSPSYFDLLYKKERIEGRGNVLIRLAGNVIKEIIHTREGDSLEVIPVGIVLSIPKDKFPKAWDKLELALDMEIHGYEDLKHAVEAGPLLVEGGKFGLDMEAEAWTCKNSIRTQAARLDYTDMRGPKIAVGIDKSGNLSVLAINGRIRESVGATHIDMANIMIKYGMQKAMGFDPGGSSTLVVNNKTLNISPYNSAYERNIYSLPPEPRAVANAVIGFVKE